MAGEHRLPERMRAELARPLGRVFGSAEIKGPDFLGAVMGAAFLVTVGDRVTETVGKLGRVPDLQVVDSLENRKPRATPRVDFAVSRKARNPPGSITDEAVELMKEAIAGKRPARLLVDGEEDLLAIPAILFSPISASVFYGQPGEGIVLVDADAAAKARSRALLKRMGFPDASLAANR